MKTIKFELIFNINANKKYYFRNFVFQTNENFPLKNIEFFQNKFNKLKDDLYSKKRIEDLIDEINDFTLQNDFVFINANFKEVIKDEDKIDIIINFKDLDKYYVERINIFGNFITDEKVIRNSLIIDEGDPYNEILFNKSIQNVKARNIFETVKFNENNNDEDLNKVIDIIVEEKATGEIFAGAGTGTTGSSISAGIKENNYLGLGIKLDTNLTLTDDTIKGKFSVTNPNFNNSDKSVTTMVESSESDFMSSSGYKTSRTGFTIGTEFEQKNNLFVNLEVIQLFMKI